MSERGTGPARPLRLVPDGTLSWIDERRALLSSGPRLVTFSAEQLKRVRAALDGTPTSWDDPLAQGLLEAGLGHPAVEPCAWTGPGLVTWVIPFRGRAAALQPLLDAAPSGTPVVVVDDGSPIPLELPGRAVRIIRHQRNCGPAAARNTGLRAARTPFVAFIDADTIPPTDWDRQLLGHFADEGLAVVAPRIASTTGRSWRHRYELVRCPLDMGAQPALVRPGTAVPYAPSTAWLVRRDAVGSVGGFDESRRVGEDVDLAWRLAKAGWRVRHDPQVIVRHEPRGDFRGWLVQRQGYGRSAAPLWQAHPAHLTHLEVGTGAVAPWLVWPLAGPGGAAVVALLSAMWTMGTLRLPPLVAVRLTAAATWRTGGYIAAYLRRVALPVLLLAAGASASGRHLLALAVLPYGLEWLRARPRLDPLRYAAARAADDVSYCVGLWQGVIARGALGTVGVRWRRRRGSQAPPLARHLARWRRRASAAS